MAKINENRIKEIREQIKSLTWGEILVGQRAYHVEQHINVPDSFLKERIIKEGVSAASTFDISNEEVLEKIKETLLEEEYQTIECIAEWLDDPSAELEYSFYKEYEEPIGHCFIKSKKHDWRKGAIKCSEIMIVLGMNINYYGNTWYIKTVYANPVAGKDF